MKKFNAFTILCMMFFMASPLLLNAQVPENGLVFDGFDDYVYVSTESRDELNPEENLTVETWAYLDSAAAGVHQPFFVARLNSYSLALSSGGSILMYLRTDEGTWYTIGGTTTILPGSWYHLACTYDGSVARVYVNGVQEGSQTINDTIAASTANYRLGARNNVPNQTNLIGRMDETRVWDVTRTQAEIQEAMNHTIPGSTSGLVGYWRFDNTSGSTTPDISGYNNTGFLNNMSTPGVWQTSTAPIGESSIFAVSSDITETSECAVDVDFYTGDGPGSGYSMAVMQVNELPNTVSGLYPDRANLYWEIWSEDPDFDGSFGVDVRFHYDDISGLPTESSVELFRRDDATDTWTVVPGFSIFSNDGGTSTTTDGIGYIEYYPDEVSGFGGQYILSWTNEPPVVSDIPDQTVAEGSPFATINLDDYVADPDHADNQITWTASGATDVTVTITDRVATITADDPEWNGSNVVTFTAEDPEGEMDSDDVTFEVTVVYDPPVVGDIPDQEIAEGASFATIALDDFVTDADNDITTLTWTASGQTDLSVDITDRVATITMDPEWNGSETVTLQAEDPDGETGSDQATFTVTPVNDAPVISIILNQTIAEGESFTPIVLDDYVSDADDADSMLTWTTADEVNVTIDITDRVATATVNDPEWNGNERITFTVEDTSGLQDFVHVRFIVTAVNDAPVVAGIPDQTIAEGQSFSQVNLDDFVSDADDVDDSLGWKATGQSDIMVSIVDRVATFTVDPEWNGTETIIFTATDTSGASDADTCILMVTPVNDAPTLNQAIPDTSAVAETAFLFVLDPNTFADIDQGDSLVLSANTPAWLTFDPATGTFSGTPADADKGILEVIVTATDGSSASIADTFMIEVISYVGISNPLEGLGISLYPNPNNGRFVIESDMFEMKDVVLEIFNEKGQLVWNREIRDEIGTLHETVDLNNATDGLYLLRVRTRTGMINKRFVIGY